MYVCLCVRVNSRHQTPASLNSAKRHGSASQQYNSRKNSNIQIMVTWPGLRLFSNIYHIYMQCKYDFIGTICDWGPVHVTQISVSKIFSNIISEILKHKFSYKFRLIFSDKLPFSKNFIGDEKLSSWSDGRNIGLMVRS